MSEWQLYGRSSSLYTRVVRIFSLEMAVPIELVPVSDLASLDPAHYGGHPALKLPALRIGDETVLGTEHICRWIAGASKRSLQVAWPEDHLGCLGGNAQELVWHAMTAQVQLIMTVQVGKLPADNRSLAKVRAGLEGALRWLDDRLGHILGAMPPARDLSLFEVTLHCLIEHLPFRRTLQIEAYPALASFSAQWSCRESSRATDYWYQQPLPGAP